MTITALPPAPSTSDPTTFDAKADALIAALPTFVTETNAVAVAMNLNSTTDTSASSVLIGTGAKTFTVTSGKSFQPGMYLVCADTAAPSTNSMYCQITSYSGTTLVVNSLAVAGSGTKTAWVISQSAGGASGFAAVGANSDITSMTGLSAPTVLANPIRATDIQAQTVTAFTTAGTSTAYTLTTLATGLALTTGERWRVKFNATAGATPTLNRDGKGAVALKLYTSAGAKVAASATTIIANMLTDVEYDGTDYVILNSLSPVAITNATMQASTSGTAINFTGIPAGKKRVTVMVSGLSKNGTSHIIVQIGDAGGIEATGYLGSSFANGSNASFTTGFGIYAAGAGQTLHGAMILTLMDESTNLWVAQGNFGWSDAAALSSSGGAKALSATLDRITITMVNGTDAFDAGNINISYE